MTIKRLIDRWITSPPPGCEVEEGTDYFAPIQVYPLLPHNNLITLNLWWFYYFLMWCYSMYYILNLQDDIIILLYMSLILLYILQAQIFSHRAKGFAEVWGLLKWNKSMLAVSLRISLWTRPLRRCPSARRTAITTKPSPTSAVTAPPADGYATASWHSRTR